MKTRLLAVVGCARAGSRQKGCTISRSIKQILFNHTNLRFRRTIFAALLPIIKFCNLIGGNEMGKRTGKHGYGIQGIE